MAQTLANLLETLFPLWKNWIPGRWRTLHTESTACTWVTWPESFRLPILEPERVREQALGWPGGRGCPDTEWLASIMHKTASLSLQAGPVRMWPADPHDTVSDLLLDMHRTVAWHRCERQKWGTLDHWATAFFWILRDAYDKNQDSWRQLWTRQGPIDPPPLQSRQGFDHWTHWADIIDQFHLNQVTVIPAPRTPYEAWQALTDLSYAFLLQVQAYPVDHGTPATVSQWQGWAAQRYWDLLRPVLPDDSQTGGLYTADPTVRQFHWWLIHVLEWGDDWRYTQGYWRTWLDHLQQALTVLPTTPSSADYPLHNEPLDTEALRLWLTRQVPDEPSTWLTQDYPPLVAQDPLRAI